MHVREDLTLRDGIYKSLPLGRAWKTLLRSCEREKERGETASLKATRAVALHLRNEISPEFLPNLNSRARQGNTLLPGFPIFAPDVTCRDLGGSNSPFEIDVLSRVKRLDASGIRGRSLVEQALRESIEEVKARQGWHIEQHCISEAGTSAKPVIKAVHEALAGVDSRSIASSLVNGQLPETSHIKNVEVDPDEDLTKVK